MKRKQANSFQKMSWSHKLRVKKCKASHIHYTYLKSNHCKIRKNGFKVKFRIVKGWKSVNSVSNNSATKWHHPLDTIIVSMLLVLQGMKLIFKQNKLLAPYPLYFSLAVILYKDKFAVEPQDTVVSEYEKKWVGHSHVEESHFLRHWHFQAVSGSPCGTLPTYLEIRDIPGNVITLEP